VTDNELLVRFSKIQVKNLPVSGPLIRENAKKIAGVYDWMISKLQIRGLNNSEKA